LKDATALRERSLDRGINLRVDKELPLLNVRWGEI
jgi:hypothetical protein